MRRRLLIGAAVVVVFLNAPQLGQPLARALDSLPKTLRPAWLLPHQQRPTPAPAGRAPSAIAKQAVAFALGQRGKPYRWGAEGPGSFDCSGLTFAAYQAAGLGWSRMTAADQWRWLRARGRLVPRGRLAPGDLVFFAHQHSAATIYHVGLYVGNSRMVEAPYSGALVRVVSINPAGLFGAGRPAPAGGDRR
jgi:cell wall-associated NlpC family hydrolase